MQDLRSLWAGWAEPAGCRGRFTSMAPKLRHNPSPSLLPRGASRKACMHFCPLPGQTVASLTCPAKITATLSDPVWVLVSALAYLVAGWAGGGAPGSITLVQLACIRPECMCVFFNFIFIAIFCLWNTVYCMWFPVTEERVVFYELGRKLKKTCIDKN